MGNGFLHIGKVHRPTPTHKGQQFLRTRSRVSVPRVTRCAGVQQRHHVAGQKTVVDETVFINIQLRITPLQISRLVAFHAVAQYQILRPRWSAHRVGLQEAEFTDGSR